MKSAELRTKFLEYFRGQGHAVVPSSPLVPGNDPTLLFTNAGMVPFKDVFLGREERDYVRAASCQRCVRAGGKHNDLENVGYTARHHTFFEMLGNFSFGDYFKREAILYGWEFLTEELGLPAEKLFVTVFEEDEDAARIWLDEVGIDPDKFARIGAHDNFWSMGDTGPCGPCSEIFYDHGPDVPGGPPGTPEEDGDRFVEIWNLVFMQYDRDKSGTLHPLPRPSVDTGMGLERLAAVMQGVHSNYRIDLFENLIAAAAAVIGCEERSGDFRSSLNVVADHIRSCAFLIVDGVLPSNEGRGYVLRRIIRRAARHGHKLGAEGTFFHRLVEPLVAEMGEHYPELARGAEQAERVLRREEERFNETLAAGMAILREAIADLDGKTIPGETVFQLYDTYGFPADLTADVAREQGLEVDFEGFEKAMGRQRERARAASHFEMEEAAIETDARTEFTGYGTTADSGRVVGLFAGGRPVERLENGQDGVVVLDRTAFYAESGGQVGDRGELRIDGETAFQVEDTQKQGDAFAHIGRVHRGHVELGDVMSAEVDRERRQAIRLNHSATHLLHAALREVLGEHVAQKGSLVAPDALRFDFSHFEALTDAEREAIERKVNAEIRANVPVETRLMRLDEAREAGAMALFGEKYADEVRVVGMGEFSLELCGGTHVERTGDIGFFKITSEGGVAAGVRRIEAVTGAEAEALVREEERILGRLAGMLKTRPDELEKKLAQFLEQSRATDKALEQAKARLSAQAGAELSDQAVEVDGLKVLAARLDGADVKTLRSTLDQLKNKLGEAAVVLGSAENGKVRLVAGVTKGATDRVKAGELVNAVAEQVGGRGGGRPDMAQAGGSQPENLDGALQSVPDWVRERL